MPALKAFSPFPVMIATHWSSGLFQLYKISEVGVTVLLSGILIAFFLPNSAAMGERQQHGPTALATALVPPLVVFILLMSIKSDNSPFLYFNF